MPIGLKFCEEACIDIVGLFRFQTQFQAFKHIQQFFAVDKFDWRDPVSDGLLFASTVKMPVVMKRPLSVRPIMAPLKSLTWEGVTEPT